MRYLTLISAPVLLLTSACSTLFGQSETRLRPPACQWPSALTLPARDNDIYQKAPLIERPIGEVQYKNLGSLIEAGNKEIVLYNNKIPAGSKKAREADEKAVIEHNATTVKLEKLCTDTLDEWLEG